MKIKLKHTVTLTVEHEYDPADFVDDADFEEAFNEGEVDSAAFADCVHEQISDQNDMFTFAELFDLPGSRLQVQVSRA